MILSLALCVLPAASTAGEPPRLVGEFGGRAVSGSDILVLDLAPPAIRLVDRRTLTVRTTPLSGGGGRLDPYGIAAHRDGTVSALADRGRTLVRLSAATGERLESRRLPEPGQGVTSFWDRLGLIAIRLRAGEPLLLEQAGERFRPFSTILSRSGATPAAHLIGNLLRCGSGTEGALPCWFLAGPPDVALVHRDGSVTRIRVPTFAPAVARKAAGWDPGAAFVYPVRDAFLEPGGLWVLSNQEGDRTPLEEGAVRARHVAHVREGRTLQVIALDREGRAILDAGPGRLVMLYADRSIGAVSVR
ncbi:MAG TPA: hypothetical protein VFF17_10950 [Thermoanaerobaculia bacterium]|nr:hypothetical protein [Thermoanaerobaculia bacterium]